ncbi:MAG TPA: hypothetical protein VK971_03020, partial [Thiohalobacter sp.]|nr:hypothetical protein [Thiohalobacter sp.]
MKRSALIASRVMGCGAAHLHPSYPPAPHTAAWPDQPPDLSPTAMSQSALQTDAFSSKEEADFQRDGYVIV